MRYFWQPLALSAVSIWMAVTLAFFLLRLLPGDAVDVRLMQSGAGPEVIAERRTLLGLDAPPLEQYLRYAAGLLRGDLGVSLVSGLPVSEIIGQQFPATLSLALPALALSAACGILLGMLAARPVGWGAALVARLLIGFSLSTPVFWTATLLIYGFAVVLEWLPPGGVGTVSHLIMPVMVLGFHSSGAVAQVTRSGVQELLRADFVRTARAKGLPEQVVLQRHVLRAALPPVIAVIGLQGGFLLGGTVITEGIFVRPGIGQVLLTAVFQQDYPVVQGVLVLSAVLFVGINLLTDVLYRLLDPRVRA